MTRKRLSSLSRRVSLINQILQTATVKSSVALMEAVLELEILVAQARPSLVQTMEEAAELRRPQKTNLQPRIHQCTVVPICGQRILTRKLMTSLGLLSR